MRRKIIHFAATSLTTIGINVLKEDTGSSSLNIWRLISTFSFFGSAGFLTFMASVTNTQDFYTFVNPSPYIAGATVILSGIYFMHHHRKLIGEMFYQMDCNFYTYPDEHLIRLEYEWYLQEDTITTVMGLAKYGLFFVWVIDSSPIFMELIFNREIKTMVYPRWTPWKVKSLRDEFLMFLLQSAQAMCGLWFNYVIMIFLLVTASEFMRQYKRLIVAVSSIKSRTSTIVLYQMPERRSFNVVLRENIVHCIKHHQILHKNFNSYKTWFSIFFSIELAISVVTFAFALYVLLNAPSLSNMLNYFAVILLIWTNLLIICLISEVFSNLNDKLARALISDSPWYQTNAENSKLLVMFHSLACQQPLRLFGLSIFEANRVTFGQLVRMTYSFVNVLNLSLK